MIDPQIFKKVLTNAGAVNLEPIISDGEFHRHQDKVDKNGQKSGWYTLFEHGDLLVGAYGNWRTGLSEVWCSKSEHTRRNHGQRLR